METHPYNYIIKRESKYGHFLMMSDNERDLVDWQWKNTKDVTQLKEKFNLKVIKMTYDETKEFIDKWSANSENKYYLKQISKDKL